MFTIALQFRFVALLLGYILPLHEDAGDVALVLDDRLQHEVQDRLFRFPVRLALEKQRHALADVGSTRAVDLVQQVDQPLVDNFGQALANRLAQQLAMPGHLSVSIVDQFVDVIRPAQETDESRRLSEEAPQLLALGLQQPGAGHDALLELLHRLMPGSLLQRILHGLQLGDVGGVLQDGHDFTLLIQDRRVRGAPVAILVDRPERRVAGDGITDYRQRIDGLAAEHAGKGVEQLLHTSRLGAERVCCERFVKALPLDLLQPAAGQGQVSRVGIEDDQIAIEQNIGVRRQPEQTLERRALLHTTSMVRA